MRIDMINLFFRNRRKSENALAPSIIKIIGVGNGGVNVINHLQTHGFKKDSLWACDMDGSVVKRAVTTHCLLLGQDGLGSGNSSELARKEAKKRIGEIRSMIDKGHPEVTFVVACLGGGCGTGVSPIIAEESRKMGIKTIGVVTLPFEFEGSRKFNQAEAGLAELAKNTDAMFVLNNQYLLDHHQDLSMMDAFTRADALACVAIRSIMDDL
jgi:cell division protein FtsZ